MKHVFLIWDHLSARDIYVVSSEATKSLQSCPTLCDPIDGSPSGFPVPGILQARTLEWVAISFSNAWKWKVKVKSLSRVRFFATHGLQPSRLLPPWDSPGKSTGVGCHSLTSPCEFWKGLKFHVISCYQVTLVVKNPPANAGDFKDEGSIPGSGRSLGGGNDKPLQYPCLENHMDRGAWQATIHRV